MTITEFLQTQVPFLTGLTADQAHALAEEAQQLQFKKDQAIIRQGITVDGLHVIAQGKASVWIKLPNKQPAQVATLGVGDVFGERSIIEFGVAGATIKALDECLIFMVPQDAFLALMEQNPELKGHFMAAIENRRKPLASNPKPDAPPPPAAPPKA
jgi:CRP-like cAMP-binding protein